VKKQAKSSIPEQSETNPRVEGSIPSARTQVKQGLQRHRDNARDKKRNFEVEVWFSDSTAWHFECLEVRSRSSGWASELARMEISSRPGVLAIEHVTTREVLP